QPSPFMDTQKEELSIPRLIRRKRDGEELQGEEICYFVQAVKEGTIQESQIGALLMAIWQHGMEQQEILAMIKEMMVSGTVLQWPKEWCGIVVDKHSTGGVGDKVSLPLAPALAACGYKVPMISGRGLAHTGGTLDKMESVPGFNVDQSPEQITQMLEDVGCCIVGQADSLVPADKILYAIRDITSTVDSLPLITASIMSKKGAESLSALILDVKYGSAALYKSIESARELAHSLVRVGKHLGICTTAVLSKMDNPIGQNIGNSLEVMESIECLKGRGPADLRGLVTSLGAHLLYMCRKADTLQSGMEQIGRVLDNGTALLKFQAMLEAQGVQAGIARSLCQGNGDVDYFRVMGRAQHQEELRAEKEGVVEAIWAMPLAEMCHELGAGRTKAGTPINHRVGIELLVSLGDHVQKGSPWIRVHRGFPALTDNQKSHLQEALVIGNGKNFTTCSRISEVITSESIDNVQVNKTSEVN
uniref:Thymidine phosphorylase n=1 Tax=Latimeria chalumnae TaxID=7897 RepID=H3AY36_LATCH